MATGHINPGYDAKVSRFMRGSSHLVPQSSLPAGQMLRDIKTNGADTFDLEEIRRKAREVWSRPETRSTSYQNFFDDKLPSMDEIVSSRPTSGSRKNKPHPSLPFMTCRLHAVPGFFNPDATVGRDPYQLDGMVPQSQRSARAGIKAKYAARPNTSAIKQYSNTFPEPDVVPINSGRGSHQMQHFNQGEPDELTPPPVLEDYIEEDYSMALQPHTPMASLHRYLKPAGLEERQRLQRMRYKSYSADHRPNSMTLGGMRANDIESRRRTSYVHKSKRGDFLLHPDWPPSLPHHRLNGLSSVDIPYLPGRR